MKREVNIRSPSNTELRRGDRKRQPSRHAWHTPTNGEEILLGDGVPPRRFFDEGEPVAASSRAPAPRPPCADPWTEEEDAVLREGVLRFGTAAWPEVSRHLLPPVNGGPQKRSSADCEARWDAVVKHTAVKGPWLPEEDALLRQLVAKFGPKRWALIASHIPGRAGKQCRERWLNHLDTRVIKSDWTADEDAVLLDAQQRVGNKWSEIARLLPGRAENAVKNRFNSLITKRLTHGIEHALAHDELREHRTVAAPLEDVDLTRKTAAELLDLVFRRVGETPHVQRRVPEDLKDIADDDDDDAPPRGALDLGLALEPPPPRARRAKPGAAAPANDDADAVGLRLARRFWAQELARGELLGRVSWSEADWDLLEAKAAMHAQDDPIRVAAATAAAAHALGGGPAPAAAPPQDPPARFAARPQVCESPRQKKSPRDDADDVMAASSSLSGAGGLASFLASSTSNLDLLSSASFRGPTASAGASASNARGGGRRPRIDGALRLSETLCSLSLDDASWLGDVVDASLNVDTTRTSWNVSPRASRDVLMAMPPPSAFAGGTTPSHAAGGAAGAPARMAAPPPRASFRDFKMSASIDDWGSALAGSSLAGGAGAGAVAFASDHPLAATVDEQVWRLSPRAGLAGHVAPSPPSPARDPMRRSSGTDLAHVTDTSMSLDNVDWDLILKMSHTPRNADGSADTFVRPHGISAIDFDPRSHFSPPDDDITPRAKRLLAMALNGRS